MPEAVTIVLWAATPERPRDAAAPFVYALAACAMDARVEMHYTAGSVEWLLPGVAEAAYTDDARTRTVLTLIRETHAAGVRHYACAMAFAERAAGRPLICEAAGVAGAATVVAQALEGARVVVF